MNIKHTRSERYLVYFYLPCESELFKQIKRWFYFKSYASKQGALKAIQRRKESHQNDIESGLVYKIVWIPSPYARDDQRVTVYDEDMEVKKMKKEFIKRVCIKGTVDTRNYRYTVRQSVNWVRNRQTLQIVRLPIKSLGTTDQIDGWEVVKVFESSGIDRLLRFKVSEEVN